MNRRNFLRGMAFGAGAMVAPRLGRAAEKRKQPNILLILADDMGYSDLGCYGSEISTPNLDRLAANGLRFTQFYNTARCWPTRSCTLTGYYAQQIGSDPQYGQFPPWTRMIPQQLKPKGYRCYHSGKWHVGNAPRPVEDGGFDLTGGQTMGENHGSDTIADHAIECLKDHRADHADAPFFSYVCFTAPHFPLIATKADIDKYRDHYKEGWDVVRERRWKNLQKLGIVNCELSKLENDVLPPGFKEDCLKTYGPGEIPRAVNWSDLTDVQKEYQSAKMAIHAAMVDRMDCEIGRILEQLKTMNVMEDTVIFFISDNGASAEMMIRAWGHKPTAEPGSMETYQCLGPGWSSCSNTPFRRHKIWVHEGGISTPLIVHWPRGIAAKGELRHDVGHCVDFAPTFFDLAGQIPADTGAPKRPGRSLLPAFEKDTGVPHEPVFFKHQGHKGLRVDDWKAVVGEGDTWELYNLKADRSEMKNLAGQEPERLKSMTEQWNKLDAEYLAQAGPKPEKSPDKKHAVKED